MKTWLDIATAAFGEPSIAFPEPTRTGRRCWAWFVNGQNFHIAIDIERGRTDRVHTWAGSPGRRAELWSNADPTDADIQAICAYAWPGYAGVTPC